jgi:imidazolonepropionase
MKNTSIYILKNCKGIFTGEGFKKKHGRLVSQKDMGFIGGPLDIHIDIVSGRIHAIEKTTRSKSADEEFDASELWVTSGFFDSHTHSLFSGTRAREYFLRWSGKSYLEISQAGGGIRNTMNDTLLGLNEQHLTFLNRFEHTLKKMFKMGTCVVEIKTGYAPTPEGELAMLRFLKKFSHTRPIIGRPEIVTTFLPLHSLPKGESEDQFVKKMIQLLPQINKEKLAHFVDAFPEKGFFDLKSAIRLVEKSKKIGLKAKIHSDELTDMNATKTFCEMGALSVDHLQMISSSGLEALSNSKTVATLLPATSFFSNIPYVDARKIIQAGAQVALATDYNPGTAPDPSLGFTLKLAASQLKMTAAEILCATTFNGAAALGIENQNGIVSPGYNSRLCLWQTATKNTSEIIEEIIVDGLNPTTVCAPIPRWSI